MIKISKKYCAPKNKYNHSIKSFQMEAIFLTDVIKQTDFTHIDFFSLDVEGMNLKF